MPDFSSKPYELDLGDAGYIEGLSVFNSSSSKTLCHYFGGIPYAEKPQRFRAPQPLPSSHRYGSKDKPAKFNTQTGVCPQPGFPGPPNPSVWTEDCLQLNMWIPDEDKPAQGWPVLFYIHGGWLQVGEANQPPSALAPLLSETAFKAIVVMPAYRLNVFGFLASKELEEEAKANNEALGNWGFWDQRTALEWTYNNIEAFGGNKDNITCGGYSAGSYSTFWQLAHDVYLPKEKAIIKRAIMFSNGPGFQPPDVQARQEQFDEVLSVLNIPASLSAAEKMSRLRSVPVKELVELHTKVKHHEFRPVSEGDFVNKELFQYINDGTFAKHLLDRGITILNGECRDEHYAYAEWRPPLIDSYNGLYTRMLGEYPKYCIDRLMELRVPSKRLPSWADDWFDAFGQLYADLQVHDLERGFVDNMAKGGFTIGKDLLRYRIDWRAKCVDAILPPAWKVTHSSDRAIWFWGAGLGHGLLEHEKKILKEANSFFAKFVKGEEVEWSQHGPQWMYRLNDKGEMDMWKDDTFERGLEGWKAMNG